MNITRRCGMYSVMSPLVCPYPSAFAWNVRPPNSTVRSLSNPIDGGASTAPGVV